MSHTTDFIIEMQEREMAEMQPLMSIVDQMFLEAFTPPLHIQEVEMPTTQDSKEYNSLPYLYRDIPQELINVA